MPKPAYIICATGIAEDKRTELLTFFKVIEAYDVVLVNDLQQPANPDTTTKKPKVVFGIEMNVMAVWLQEETDSFDDQFESEIALVAPDGTDVTSVAHAQFSFNPKGLLYRCPVLNFIIPGFPGLGIFRMEARIKKAGEDDWRERQSFPIIVREMKKEAGDAKKSLLEQIFGPPSSQEIAE
jgi:hypothetical protein